MAAWQFVDNHVILAILPVSNPLERSIRRCWGRLHSRTCRSSQRSRLRGPDSVSHGSGLITTSKQRGDDERQRTRGHEPAQERGGERELVLGEDRSGL